MGHVYDVAAFGRMRLERHAGHKVHTGVEYGPARDAVSDFAARLRRWHRGTYYVYLLKDGRVVASVTGCGRGWAQGGR